MRKILTFALSVFFLLAGLNHFLNPEFYLGLIPDYLPYHWLINILSGTVEITLGAGVFIGRTRKLACYGIIILMIAFIPSHIYFIQIGSCVEDSLCISPWIAWVRLLIIHPLLLFWAYWVGIKN